MTDYTTKDSGERAQFESGMQRDTETGKPRFDLMIPLDVPYEDQMLTRFAKLLGRGAEKYDERNWEQADSQAELDRMKSSAFRHFMQWFTGEEDEDHAAATIFNVLVFETTQYKIRRREAEEAQRIDEVPLADEARLLLDLLLGLEEEVKEDKVAREAEDRFGDPQQWVRDYDEGAAKLGLPQSHVSHRAFANLFRPQPEIPRLLTSPMKASQAVIPPISRIFISDQTYGTYEDDDEATKRARRLINESYNPPAEDLRF